MRLRRMNLGRIQSCTNQVRQEDPTNLNYISFLWATLVALCLEYLECQNIHSNWRNIESSLGSIAAVCC